MSSHSSSYYPSFQRGRYPLRYLSSRRLPGLLIRIGLPHPFMKVSWLGILMVGVMLWRYLSMPRPKPNPTSSKFFTDKGIHSIWPSSPAVTRQSLYRHSYPSWTQFFTSIDVTYPLLPFQPLVCIFRQGDGSSYLGSGTRPSCNAIHFQWLPTS